MIKAKRTKQSEMSTKILILVSEIEKLKKEIKTKEQTIESIKQRLITLISTSKYLKSQYNKAYKRLKSVEKKSKLAQQFLKNELDMNMLIDKLSQYIKWDKAITRGSTTILETDNREIKKAYKLLKNIKENIKKQKLKTKQDITFAIKSEIDAFNKKRRKKKSKEDLLLLTPSPRRPKLRF